jgi:hypothetical protein
MTAWRTFNLLSVHMLDVPGVSSEDNTAAEDVLNIGIPIFIIVSSDI